jgi:hypothetical protein
MRQVRKQFRSHQRPVGESPGPRYESPDLEPIRELLQRIDRLLSNCNSGL